MAPSPHSPSVGIDCGGGNVPAVTGVSVGPGTGLMGRLMTAPGSVKGITFGETIYLNADAARDFEKRDRESVALLGHELTHVLQYREVGSFTFLTAYVATYEANRESGDAQPYKNIIFEQVADKVQGVIDNFLKNNLDIADKLQTGEPLSLTDLSLIGSALSDAVASGELKTGYQFINGVLVNIRE